MSVKAALALRCVAVLACVAPPCVRAQADSRLDGSESAIAAKARCEDRVRRLTADCAPAAPIERALKDRDLVRLDEDNPIPAAANAYFLCVAVAEKDEAPCAALGGIPDFEPGTYWSSSTDLCKGYYRRILLAKALISGDPSAKRLCLNKKGPAFAAERGPECDLLLKAGADLAGVCEKAVPEGPGSHSERAACERNAGAYWGLAPRCDAARLAAVPAGSTKIAAPAILDQCLVSDSAAAFRKAHAARDPGLCGDDGLCAALMGKGVKACQVYAARVQAAKKDYCSRVAADDACARSAPHQAPSAAAKDMTP